MWKYFITQLLVCVICANYVEATYNSGIKTRAYDQQPIGQNYHHYQSQHQHHQLHPATQTHYNQYSDNENDKDYQSKITHHHVHTDNSHRNQQHQQHEGDSYQEAPKASDPTQLNQQPIYERRESSQTQTGNLPNSKSSVCPAGYTGKFPYAFDCRRFLSCWNGRDYIGVCPVGSVFNPESLECDSPDKVTCGAAALGLQGVQAVGQPQPAGRPSIKQPNYRAGRYTDTTDGNVEVLCPVGVEGLQPHPSDCTRFLNCANGNMHIQQCGPGTAYSISMKVCDFKNKVDCSGREGDELAAEPRQSDYNISCPRDASGLHPHPKDCTKFLQCSNGQTFIQDCGSGTAFDSIRLICDYKDKVNCCSDCSGPETETDILVSESTHTQTAAHAPPPTSVSSTNHTQEEDLPHTGDILCPKGVTGMFTYPFDYTKFINCQKGNTAIQNCVPNTAFSISRGYCVPPDDIQTNDRVKYIVSEVNYEYSQTVNTCPPGTEGWHLYPFNPQLYIKCIKGEMKVVPCISPLLYSFDIGICLPADQMFKNSRVRLPNELDSDGNYRVTDESSSLKNKIYCPGSLPGNHSNPFDSTKYLNCEQGRLISQSCALGQTFSWLDKICLKETPYDSHYVRQETSTAHEQQFRVTNTDETHVSIDGLTYLKCPPGLIGKFFHPFDYTKYILCERDGTFVKSCVKSAVFSVSINNCLPRHRVERHDRVEYLITTNNDPNEEYNENFVINCEPGDFRLYPHGYERHKYLRCADGRIFLERCAAGQVFNKKRRVCSNEMGMGSSDRSTYHRDLSAPPGTIKTGFLNSGNIPQPSFNRSSSQDINLPSIGLEPPLPTPVNAGITGDVVCPSGAIGRYPHPFDCTKFLMCANGKTHIQNCGPGTAWNKEMEVCDFKEKVSCSTSSAILNNRDPKQHNNGVTTPHWPIANPGKNPATTQVTENRWTNMNVPRPQGPTFDQSTIWQQSANRPDRKPLGSTPVWIGSDVHVDQHNPTHTVIHEEGSFQPNRNYNRRIYNTPLAPLKPTTTTTTATSTIVYAQPVGSQEDSKEIFAPAGQQPSKAFNPHYFPTSNRQNHTRPINSWTPIRPVDVNRQDANSPQPVPLYTNSRVPVPSVSYPTPFLHNSQPSWPTAVHSNPPYDQGDSGQKPLLESEIKFDQIPGQLTYDLNDFDQLPAGTTKHNINDSSNLYGGLQPPLDPNLATTTVKSFSASQYEQTTQLVPPSKPTSPTYRVREYPQLSTATIQTFPHQPHYSPPYSEVAHSRNASWAGRKIPQHSAIKPAHRDPSNNESYNGRKNIATAPQHSGLDVPPYSNNENVEAEPATDDQEAAMKAALKLLLKPYLDPDTKVDDTNIADRAQSHIMNLVSTSDKVTTTSPTPHIPFLNKNTLVPSTTPHQADVELILAGEQHNLLGVTTTQAGNHETSTSYNSYHTPLEPTRATYNHDHNTNWHNRHHNHHNRHNSKLQHSLEFHKKHPHLPNPFDDPVDSYNPRAEGTTQRTYDFDLRIGGRCPFDCGNRQCVEVHQICDGVNNCGNRRDEQECEQLGYELRLTGGQNSNMGRVEVKILDRWGYVCDDKFGLPDADVVCRELGFKMGAMEVRGSSYYAPTDANIHFAMDEVECSGNETSLRECDFKGWGVSNCGPDEVVGVVCKVPKLKCPDNYWLCSTSKECIPTAFLCDATPDCEDGSDESEAVCNAPIKYRLEGGRSSNEGRLEVFYRGEWGTVCDDDFGLKEAQVVCNSFGFYGKSQIVKNIYGPGSGPIWLDQVSCLGNETQIDECNHWSWGENNCNHTEDVGIKCIAGPKPSTSKAHSPSTAEDASNQSLGLESRLQFGQSELDDLGLYQGLWQRSSKAVHAPKKCGRFKTNLIDEYEHPEERVINGTIAKRGRHPWQATIRTRGRGGISSHWCGAVIISRKLILTAAHCLAGYPKGSYFVRMGDHYANIAESSEIDSNIENWYIHEKFRDKKHMNNDIALILLKTPVHFNDYVQPVCLPEKGATLENNRMCTISGWGSIKSGTSTPSNILRAAQVPILADEVCSQKNVYANAMTEGMFCAGFLDESADACDGDSGGPLVCSDEDGETLYGIISWGQHCGYANHPGVYVRVEKYIDWIYEKINLMLQQGKL